MSLLNYTDQDGNADTALFGNLTKRSLALINQIYGELWYMVRKEPFVPLAALTQEIELPARAAHDVMPYGVAMLMAQTVGDADNQSLFATLYNRKRASVSRTDRRLDVMPGVVK